MAKKKRRRLKKGVKRGCALILAVPILLCLFFLLRGLTNYKEFKADAPQVGEVNERPECLTEMHDRLERLFLSPQRLDTTTIALEVYDIDTKSIVYQRHAGRLAPPASCMKLLTAVGAMQYLGTDYRFVTNVVARGRQVGSVFQGNLLFQLDDDPMVETLHPMVDAIRHRGIREIEGDIVLDLLREDTLKAHPTAAIWDIPYHKLPILLKGRPRIEAELRYLFSGKGIAYDQLSRKSEYPEKTGISNDILIYHHETPLTEVLAPMLIHSSNIKADALYGHIYRVAKRLPLSHPAEDWWVGPMLDRVGGDHTGFVVNDGSGLSPDNRLTAHFLVNLLRYAWEHEPMRHVLLDEALATPAHPVRRGSLLGRMSAPLYRNKIFVKTGTLTTIGLSSLAGYAQAADGRWLIFAIINENSPVAESRIFQDKLCKELVR